MRYTVYPCLVCCHLYAIHIPFLFITFFIYLYPFIFTAFSSESYNITILYYMIHVCMHRSIFFIAINNYYLHTDCYIIIYKK